MPFTRKQMAMQLRLADARDGEEQQTIEGTNAQSVTLEGYRTDCIIDMTGQVLSMARLELRVFGLSLDTMRSFMTKRILPLAIRNDSITISVGDRDSGIHQVFGGNILSAVPNFSGMPESSFDIIAQAGYYQQINPAGANSYRGSTDVATIVQSLAKQMGYTFRNHGVTTKLADQNLSGTLLDQLSTVVEASNIVCTMNNEVIEIFPNGGNTDEGVYIISPATGMVGYPEFTRTGVDVTVEFDPNLNVGREVSLITDLPDASGSWFVQNMRHELSTVTPEGRYFTRVQLGKEGFYVKRF